MSQRFSLRSLMTPWAPVVLCALGVGACTPSSDEPAPADQATPPPAESSSAPATPTQDTGEAQVVATFDRIVEEVAALRDLPPKEDVPVEVVEPDELVEHALDSSAEALEHLQQIELILAALHQIPEDADLEELLEEVVGLTAVGLYDPEQGQAYLLGDGEKLSPNERAVIAHEVVHALQDQHFDLQRLSDLDEDPDAAMAFRSVVEGDAVLIEERWVDAHLSEAEQQERRAEELETGAQQMEALEALPPVLVESFIAPYTVGPELVGELRRRNGWSAVDAALAEPPETMAEVLDPSLTADDFTPADVDPGRAPAGWEELEELSWGAFEVLLLMELAEGHTPDRTVAAAWRGGQLEAWQRGEEVAVAVAWAFASPADAGRVCDVVVDWHATVADSRPAGADLHRGPDDVLRVDCAGDTVRFAVAPDSATATEVLSP